MKTISQIGEWKLLEKIQKWCAPEIKGTKFSLKEHHFTSEVPNGDDAYVVKMSSNSSIAFTTDTLFEGTHFKFSLLKPLLSKNELWNSLGYKIMAVNLSDLAAMGHVSPLFAFLTLGLNGDISVDSVDSLYLGIKKLAKFYNFFLAGGDIFRAEKSIISATVVGKIIGNRPITRSGARKGDILMISGPLGLSTAGLKILMKQGKTIVSYHKSLIQAQLKPRPKLEEGSILADRDIMATSMIDTSDDLMTSLEILSAKSGVGFDIDLGQIAVHPDLARFCRDSRVSPYSFILYGGEDYQLLFTVRPSKVSRVKNRIPSSCVLGVARESSYGISLKMNGRPFQLRDSRFKHF